MLVNYLLAAWHSPRQFDEVCPPPEKSTYYLEKQFEVLELLNHSLEQVTVIVPALEAAPKEFRDYIDNLPPSLANGTRIAVHTRENRNRSYGGYVDACHRYKDDFTHFMLVEDDYLPVVDDFDKLFLRYVNKQGGGYVCSLVQKAEGAAEDHAACSVGMVCSPCMQAAYDEHQSMMHRGYGPFGIQAWFHKPITNRGYRLGSIGGEYRVPYTDVRYWPEYIVANEDAEQPPVFVPVQFLDEFFVKG
jgi:hypothetical protein